jgi:hypothetical protein
MEYTIPSVGSFELTLITNGKVSDILKVPVSRFVENLIDSS